MWLTYEKMFFNFLQLNLFNFLKYLQTKQLHSILLYKRSTLAISIAKMSRDAKKDEFRKHLENAGALELIRKSLFQLFMDISRATGCTRGRRTRSQGRRRSPGQAGPVENTRAFLTITAGFSWDFYAWDFLAASARPCEVRSHADFFFCACFSQVQDVDWEGEGRLVVWSWGHAWQPGLTAGFSCFIF